MKKMTQEQAERYGRFSERVSNIWWGFVAAAFVLASIVYGPWLP